MNNYIRIPSKPVFGGDKVDTGFNKSCVYSSQDIFGDLVKGEMKEKRCGRSEVKEGKNRC